MNREKFLSIASAKRAELKLKSAEYVGEAVRWFRATAVSGVREVLDV